MDINHPQERPEHRAARRGWTLTREHLPVLGWVYRLVQPEGRSGSCTASAASTHACPDDSRALAAGPLTQPVRGHQTGRCPTPLWPGV
ncbi:hypothetical protein [Nocardiopsis kunsanensis]|uniref:Uncharacterized protein n=1 Tax=Nocardiopsis kunsanensis TaxID=141693 RepID=A0A919CLW8_9ACTN|nr:hypothetical protein [Nocardiopsis kunsanensis]GHD34538.1 hypothetical protein GCM10007147_40320 [Nocardiopsis kunsanensis]